MPQLANLIRNKYPDVYDDIDDGELEKSVLAKHPEYSDLVEEKKPSVFSKVKDSITNPKPFKPSGLGFKPKSQYDTKETDEAVKLLEAEGKAPYDKKEEVKPKEEESKRKGLFQGLKDIYEPFAEQVSKAGKSSYEHIKKGEYPQAFHDITSFASEPFEGIRSALSGNNPKISPEQAKEEAKSQLISLTGIPAERIKEAWNESDYPRLMGQGIAAAGMLIGTHKIGKAFEGLKPSVENSNPAIKEEFPSVRQNISVEKPYKFNGNLPNLEEPSVRQPRDIGLSSDVTPEGINLNRKLGKDLAQIESDRMASLRGSESDLSPNASEAAKELELERQRIEKANKPFVNPFEKKLEESRTELPPELRTAEEATGQIDKPIIPDTEETIFKNAQEKFNMGKTLPGEEFIPPSYAKEAPKEKEEFTSPEYAKLIGQEGELGPHNDMPPERLIQSVINGDKPAAILDNGGDKTESLIRYAKDNGLEVIDNPIVPEEPILAKDKATGEALVESLKNGDHETNGKLLGYSPEDIQKFKENIGDTTETPKTAETPIEPLTPNESLKAPSKTITKLQEFEDSALKRIKERGSFKGTRLGMGLPADDLADLAIVGAARIARGAVRFSEWSTEMIHDFGETIKPYLADLFKAAKQKHSELNLTEAESAVQKLNKSISEGLIKAKEQAKVYKEERAPRALAAKAVTTPGEVGFYRQLGKLKGEYTKLNMPPLRELLDQKEIDSIFDTISKSSIKDEFTKIHAKSGLVKLLNGDIPQQNELDILNAILKTKIELPGKPQLIKTPSLIRQLYELTRGLKSVDVPFMTSAAFRQGAGLFGTQRWFQAFAENAKSFKSEKVYNTIMDGLNDSLIHKQKVSVNPTTGRTELRSIASDIGLASSDLKTLTSREEQIRSTLVERIPVFGKYIRANNRSYTAFLNSLRTHTAEDWLKAADLIDKNGNITNIDEARKIANTINELTGHGSLNISEPLSRFTGSKRELKLDKASDALSLAFFSPRLLARDARMMNPLNYMKTDKLVRMKYLEGALRRASVWAGFTGLAALGGATVSNVLTSSDFGKAKIGNTRLDAGTGLLQWIVMLGRQALGESTSSTSGRTQELGSNYTARTRFDVMDEFMRNRIHPTLGVAVRALTATKKRPFYAGSEAIEAVSPLPASDLHDLIKDDPDLNQMLLGLLAASGSMGSQTYGPKDYGKPSWDIPEDIKFEGGKIFGQSNKDSRFGRLQP